MNPENNGGGSDGPAMNGLRNEWLFHQGNAGIFLSRTYYIKYNALTERGGLEHNRKEKIKQTDQAELHSESIKMNTVHIKTSMRTDIVS